MVKLPSHFVEEESTHLATKRHASGDSFAWAFPASIFEGKGPETKFSESVESSG